MLSIEREDQGCNKKNHLKSAESTQWVVEYWTQVHRWPSDTCVGFFYIFKSHVTSPLNSSLDANDHWVASGTENQAMGTNAKEPFHLPLTCLHWKQPLPSPLVVPLNLPWVIWVYLIDCKHLCQVVKILGKLHINEMNLHVHPIPLAKREWKE